MRDQRDTCTTDMSMPDRQAEGPPGTTKTRHACRENSTPRRPGRSRSKQSACPRLDKRERAAPRNSRQEIRMGPSSGSPHPRCARRLLDFIGEDIILKGD